MSSLGTSRCEVTYARYSASSFLLSFVLAYPFCLWSKSKNTDIVRGYLDLRTQHAQGCWPSHLLRDWLQESQALLTLLRPLALL